MRVMCDLVAAADDFTDEFRMTRGALPDHEEGRLRAVAIQQIEQARGVVGIRAVVDGEPHFALVGGEMGEHAHEPLRRRC